MKAKKCKVCKEKFEPLRALQMVCSPQCGYEYANKQKDSDWKQRKAKMKTDLMTRSDYLKLAQAAFNTYIRERDKDRSCISCGTYNGKMNAGHYMSVGSTPELRFNEDNVHKQCERCNTFYSGNLINYRISLIERIGIERVEFLERKDHAPDKLTIDEIKNIALKYKKLAKKLAQQM
jgi:hypothetical protein